MSDDSCLQSFLHLTVCHSRAFTFYLAFPVKINKKYQQLYSKRTWSKSFRRQPKVVASIVANREGLLAAGRVYGHQSTTEVIVASFPIVRFCMPNSWILRHTAFVKWKTHSLSCTSGNTRGAVPGNQQLSKACRLKKKNQWFYCMIITI